MGIKTFTTMTSASFLAATSMAYCFRSPVSYIETGYYWSQPPTNDSTPFKAGKHSTWQSTDTVIDETGVTNSDSASITLRPGFDPKRELSHLDLMLPMLP